MWYVDAYFSFKKALGIMFLRFCVCDHLNIATWSILWLKPDTRCRARKKTGRGFAWQIFPAVNVIIIKVMTTIGCMIDISEAPDEG